jgi:uncharacterized FAD-dependent dehydrogenase
MAVDDLVRIEEIALGLNESENLLKSKIAEILALPEADILNYQVVKKAIDSRKKSAVIFVYSVDVELKDISKLKEFKIRYRVRLHKPYIYEIKKVTPAILKGKDFENFKRPLIIGSGPSGLFAALILAQAGLKPLVCERGEELDSRLKTVSEFLSSRNLNPESNVQFGEGGAGTFSDGKLYTLINDPRSAYIFSEFIRAGAPEEIAYSAAPHIGTDKLREVVKNIRARIISLGGEFKFNYRLSDLEIKAGKITAAIFNETEKISVGDLILAIGHSARDTYKMLDEKKIMMSAKAYAIGLRIEHSAQAINKAQYGNFYNSKKLGTARYKLVEHVEGERSAYTFCMCPGGYVIGAASEIGGVVTNGMSEYLQDGKNSNSALLVPVLPADFNSDSPLAGIEFQRFWERKAYELGGSDYSAPAQLVGDFLAGRPSLKIASVNPTYKPGIKLTSLENCLPPYVISSLKKAIPLMNRKIAGFADPEAVLTGVETRTSSPLRIIRDELFEASIKGIYPAGEGAGYAGGIVSSAIDGLTVAEAIIDKINLRFG